MKRKLAHPITLGLAATCLSTVVLSANTIYWDGAAVANPGSPWDSAANWSSIPGATSPDPGAAPGASDDVIFNIAGATARTQIYLDADQAAQSMTFNSPGGVDIFANSSDMIERYLTIGSGGVLMNPGSGQVVLSSTPGSYGTINVQVNTSQTWKNNSSALLALFGNSTSGPTATTIASGQILTFDGTGPSSVGQSGSTANITGEGGIAKSGSGTLTLFSNSDFSGGTTLNAGTIAIGNVGALGLGGSLTLNGGVLRSDSFTNRNLTGKLAGGVTVNSNVSFGDTLMYGDTNYAGGTGNLSFDANINLGATTRTITCNSAVTIGGAGLISGGATSGLIKIGPNSLVLQGNTGCTFGGGLTIGGGIVSAQFTNMTTPTDMIGTGNHVNFSYGNPQLIFVSKTGVSNSQTLGNVTVNNSRAQIFVNSGTVGTGFQLKLGTINSSMSAGAGTLDFVLSALGGVGATTTSAPDATGIYGPRVIYSADSGVTRNWAATASGAAPYTMGTYTAYATMAATDPDPLVNSTNARLASGTLTTTDSQTHNTLKVAGGAALTLGDGTTLTLTGGGVLMDGSAAGTLITGGTITAGDGGSSMGYNPYELVISPFNSHPNGVTVSSVIADNSADSGHAVSVTINGGTAGGTNGPISAVIALGTANTYTGTTTLNGASTLGNDFRTIDARLGIASGTATFGNAGPLALNGAIVRVAGADTTGRAITLNHSCGFHAQAFTVTLDGPITGTGNLSVDCNPGGNLVLGNDNSFSGEVLFQTDGKLTLNHVDALKNATLNLTGQRVSAVLNGASGNLAYNIGGLKGNAVALNLGTGGGTGGKVSIGSNAQSNTFRGALGAATDTAGLIKKGLGTQTVVKCAYTGDTVVEAGTLKLGTAGALSSANRAVSQDATLVKPQFTVAFTDLPNLAVGQTVYVNGVPNNEIFAIDSSTPKVYLKNALANGSPTISADPMNGSIASPVMEVKAGATLDVATLSSAFPVSSTQTLGGAGTVTGPISVAGDISPGVGAANLATSTGTLTTGNVAFTATGEYACTLNGATCDLLAAGSLTVDPAAKITFTGAPTASSLIIATYSGAEPTHFATDASLPSGYSLDYTTPGQIKLVGSPTTPPYQAWTTAKGLSGGAANSTADPDGDDLDNAIEFVIGGEPNPANPGANSSAQAPTIQTTSTELVFTFRRSAQSLTQSGINIVVRYGSNLSNWTEVAIPASTPGSPVNGATIIITPDGFGAGVDKAEVKIPKSLAIGARLFAGLKVTIPAP